MPLTPVAAALLCTCFTSLLCVMGLCLSQLSPTMGGEVFDPALLMLQVVDVLVESRSAMLVPKLAKLLFPAPFEAGEPRLSCTGWQARSITHVYFVTCSLTL